MNDDAPLREALKKSIPPLSNAELERDLWPTMLRRLDEREVRVHWIDWALMAMLAIWCLMFPNAILALVYHL